MENKLLQEVRMKNLYQKSHKGIFLSSGLSEMAKNSDDEAFSLAEVFRIVMRLKNRAV